MNNYILLNYPKKIALITGLSLILMAVFAGIGYGYAFSSFYVAEDNSTTLRNLNEFGGMFRLTVGTFTMILILDIVVTWSIYELFKKVNQSFSLIIALFRFLYSGILASAILCLLFVLELLQTVTQDRDMIIIYLNLFLNTWSWGLIIFGCHLFLLGIIVNKSDLFPKAIGYITSFAGLCYFFHHTFHLIFPFYQHYKDEIEGLVALPMALGELLLAIWLIRYRFSKAPKI